MATARNELAQSFETEADMEAFLAMRGDPWRFTATSARTWDEHETDVHLKGSKPFPQYEYLEEACRMIHQNSAVVIVKSRQLLLSWLFAAYTAWEVLFHTFTRVLIISKDQDASYAVRDRTRHILDNLPWEVSYRLHEEDVPGQDALKFDKDKASILRLSGRSEAVFLPQSKSAGRGYPARVVLGDEMAFWAWAEEIYTGIEPTLSGGAAVQGPRGPKMVLSSTPNGIGTLHNRIYSNAAEMGFTPLKLHYSQHPQRDPETPEGRTWRAATLKRLGKRRFAQEHDCAALQSGAVVFGEEYLKPRCIKPSEQWVRKAVRWAERVGNHDPFWIGVDVAEGVAGGDRCSIHIIHAESGRVVWSYAACLKPKEFARKIKRALDLFPGQIGVEKNGPGGILILVLEDMGYGDRLYSHKEFDAKTKQMGRKVGWVTSSKSKPIMIGELDNALEEGDVLLMEEDRETLAELTVYEYKEGSEHSGAPEGFHDDRVISLAIAYQMRKSTGGGLESVG